MIRMPGLSIPPTVWGPFLWHTIHIVALGYSVTPTYAEKKAAKEFYESFAILIPCPVCKDHYSKYLAENPLTPHLDTRKDLFEWTVKIHNLVNKSLNKPEVSPLEAIQWISTLGTRGRSPVWTAKDEEAINIKSILIGIGATTLIGGLAVGGYYVYTKSKD
jgi:hypothetical protein